MLTQSYVQNALGRHGKRKPGQLGGRRTRPPSLPLPQQTCSSETNSRSDSHLNIKLTLAIGIKGIQLLVYFPQFPFGFLLLFLFLFIFHKNLSSMGKF